MFAESDDLAAELLAIIDLPSLDASPKVRTSEVACSLALEHWHSVRALLSIGYLPSALTVHRAQFEAIVRSVWLLYAASDTDVSKLSAELSIETEQAANHTPPLSNMMAGLSRHGPTQAYEAFSRFKDNSWKALNSYVHAGIHPIRRHSDGYPRALLHDVLRNANGLAVVSCMQAVVLCGRQPLQRQVLAIAEAHSTCMPPPLAQS